MKKALIIGGGFAGCAAAHQLKLLNKGWNVTLIESGQNLGAGVKTQWYGGHPYTFGPRHFLTGDESLFNFLNKYVPLRRLKHTFNSYIESDSSFYNFPLHMDDVKKMPDYEKISKELNALDEKNVKVENMEELWLSSAGPTLYEKYARHYNEKMWMVESTSEIDLGVTTFASKGSIVHTGSKEAFHEKISAYPYSPSGYDPYFVIATDGCEICLNTRVEQYDIQNAKVEIGGEWRTYDLIINTISLDQLFDYEYGELKFVGLDFYPIVLPVKQLLPDDIFFIYYSGKEPHKRIVEYKKFTQHQSDHTLIGLEVPSLNGKHYPMPIKKHYETQKKYEALLPENVYSIGRAGSYKYIDIDDCIEQAMMVAKMIS